jgi:murein DD-endopeptidase MepM/ murein hydrolase activator NlpD
VDLGTPTGTPINASDGGEVVYVDYAGGYGKTVVIDHGNGYQSRYSHLNAYNVSVGTQVDQGQQIATSGSTGNGTGPHLDFGIYQNSGSNFPPKGTAVDPENFINF